MTPQPPKQPNDDDDDKGNKTPTGDSREAGLSDDDRAQAQSIRIPEYERQLRDAHGNPETDDDGVNTRVRDVMDDYNEEREKRFKARK